MSCTKNKLVAKNVVLESTTFLLLKLKIREIIVWSKVELTAGKKLNPML